MLTLASDVESSCQWPVGGWRSEGRLDEQRVRRNDGSGGRPQLNLPETFSRLPSAGPVSLVKHTLSERRIGTRLPFCLKADALSSTGQRHQRPASLLSSFSSLALAEKERKDSDQPQVRVGGHV